MIYATTMPPIVSQFCLKQGKILYVLSEKTVKIKVCLPMVLCSPYSSKPWEEVDEEIIRVKCSSGDPSRGDGNYTLKRKS